MSKFKIDSQRFRCTETHTASQDVVVSFPSAGVISPSDGTTAPLSGCVLITSKGSEIQIISVLTLQVASVKIASVAKELTDNKSRAW